MDLYKFRSGHSLLVQSGQYGSGETVVCWAWCVLTQRELMLNFQESFEKANFILVAETDNDGRIYIMEIGQRYKEGPSLTPGVY